jgi:hypothetical protein
MKIRAIRGAIGIVAVGAGADVERAGVGGRIGEGLVAVERVGADGAAVQRVEAVGRKAVGRRRDAGPVLRDGDPAGAADGVGGPAVDGYAGGLAAG